MKKVLYILLAMLGLSASVFIALPAFADEVPEGCVSSSIISNREINGKKYYCDDSGEGDGVFYILGIVVNVLTFGIGTAAVVGLVVAGIQYLTAGDNAGQVQKAKMRIFHIVIGLAIYAVFWGILQFLLPGGLFGDGTR